MNRRAQIFKLWFPVVIWAGLIFFLSGIPDLKTHLKYDFMLRKICHMLEYLILTFLLYRAFKGSFNMNSSRLVIYPATLSFLYAVSDEIHQSFTPGRNCSMGDVLIDSIGIIVFYIAIKFFMHKKLADSQ
jgi:VanZ family protein